MALEKSETPGSGREVEVDFFAIVVGLWRRRLLVGGLTVGIMSAVGVISFLGMPSVYEASSVIRTERSRPLATEPYSELTLRTLSYGEPAVYQKILLADEVLQNVSHATGLSVKELESRLRTDVVPNTMMVRLFAQGGSSRAAEQLGDLWFNEFRKVMLRLWKEKLEQELEVQRATLDGIREGLAELKADRRSAGGVVVMPEADLVVKLGELRQSESLLRRLEQGRLDDIVVLEPFRSDPDPVSPHRLLMVVGAGIAAIFAACFTMFAVEGWRVYRRMGISRDF